MAERMTEVRLGELDCVWRNRGLDRDEQEELLTEADKARAEEHTLRAEVKALTSPRPCERCSGRCRPVQHVVAEQELALTAMRHSDAPAKAEALLRQTFRELRGCCEECSQGASHG